MPGEKKDEAELPAPNAGELDVLAVLWQEQLGDQESLPLTEVHRRVCKLREQFGEPGPALTTVSTHLRNLVEKGLIEEAPRPGSGSAPPRVPVRTRGGFTPPTRAPFSTYRAGQPPGDVLRSTLRGLALAYPEANRLDIFLDLARALELSEETAAKLQKLLQAEKARGQSKDR